MTTALLKDACDEHGMNRVAMIDDVFDAPDPKRLDRERYRAFRRIYNDDEVMRRAVSRVAGVAAPELPPFEELQETDLDPVWRAIWKPRVGGRRLAVRTTGLIQELFTGHGHDALGMLDLVIQMLDLFRVDLARTVTVHGTSFDAEELARTDVVLVDFYLGQNLTLAQALEKSTDAVAEIVGAARAAGRATPSFLLVSSKAEEIDQKVFRTKAQLMKSRFRLFPKQKLTADNIAELVNLHDLIEASPQAAVVESLVEDWKSGAAKAVDAVFGQMMELDISDLIYLDFFRLTREGVTVGNYLRWFMTSSLAAGVTRELNKGVWASGEKTRLFAIDEAGLPPQAGPLAKTYDGPTSAIADAYGDLLFDESRGSGPNAFPAPLPANDLVEGDLFVKPKADGGTSLDGAQVLLVMTPSCDLLQRLPNQPPKAGSVLMLPGEMRRIKRDVDGKVVEQDTDFIRVKEGNSWQTFHLAWRMADPVALSWQEMSTDGPGEGYRRLGRIRELYFHKVREKFAGKLTRIGTEVPPLFPRPKAGKVFVRRTTAKNSEYDEVLAVGVDAGELWEFGQVKLAELKDGKIQDGKAMLLYQASRGMLERLKAALEAVGEGDDAKHAAAQDALGLINQMPIYISLVRPLKPGPRGSDGQIEVLAAAETADDPKKQANTRARILVIPLAD
ncbi:hypothetical protein [Sphingomonas abietis]|uniref:Uncharacterized protein n=1 Tax=Sphingomonas abietis TaxID=3012344 RepID=A0ABY7NTF3_9SPHN|nr:hypothetical protein [Sphingomonas abietis]WBO23219.1 hypothetical protein PBT88_03520 [Sphingomonas abietis]